MDKLKDTQTVEHIEDSPVSYVNMRYEEMKSERSRRESDRDVCDKQFQAQSQEDNYWKLIVNIPIEQNLIEMEVWRKAWDLVFDVKHDWYHVDRWQEQQAKYILQYYIDKECFYEEKKRFIMDKAKYWTWVWFTWLRVDISETPIHKEKELETQWGMEFYNNEDMRYEKHFDWKFSPQNRPVRLAYFDDKAMNQSDFSKVEDCILVEQMAKDSFIQRYQDNPYIEKDALNSSVTITDENRPYIETNDEWYISLYHYFNKVTKDYIIIVNESHLLYKWKIMYKHWCLPVVLCQHYPDTSYLYGIGICHKVRVWKAYKNNMMQYLLDGSRLSAANILAMWSSWEPVDWDIFADPWEINMLRFDNSVDDIKPIPTWVNTWPLINAMQIIDAEIRDATGVDTKSSFEAPADTLWQTEIIEENKAIRHKAVDEAYDFALDTALTHMLNNIAQFAPKVLKKVTEIKSKKWKVISKTIEFPKIKIENIKIDWRSKTIEEDYGNYGIIELTPETLSWDMVVNIITPSTYNKTLSVIEKNKITEMINNLMTMAQVYGPEAIQDFAKPEKIWEMMKIAYWYDEEMTAATKKSKTERENQEKLREVKQQIASMQQGMQQAQQNLQSNTNINEQGTQGQQNPMWWPLPQSAWLQATAWWNSWWIV